MRYLVFMMLMLGACAPVSNETMGQVLEWQRNVNGMYPTAQAGPVTCTPLPNGAVSCW